MVRVRRNWHPNGQLATGSESDDDGHTLSRQDWDEHGNRISESAYLRS